MTRSRAVDPVLTSRKKLLKIFTATTGKTGRAIPVPVETDHRQLMQYQPARVTGYR
jgi:hypothetical protein